MGCDLIVYFNNGGKELGDLSIYVSLAIKQGTLINNTERDEYGNAN